MSQEMHERSADNCKKKALFIKKGNISLREKLRFVLF